MLVVVALMVMVMVMIVPLMIMVVVMIVVVSLIDIDLLTRGPILVLVLVVGHRALGDCRFFGDQIERLVLPHLIPQTLELTVRRQLLAQ